MIHLVQLTGLLGLACHPYAKGDERTMCRLAIALGTVTSLCFWDAW